jgi:hypothetical protein
LPQSDPKEVEIDNFACEMPEKLESYEFQLKSMKEAVNEK